MTYTVPGLACRSSDHKRGTESPGGNPKEIAKGSGRKVRYLRQRKRRGYKVTSQQRVCMNNARMRKAMWLSAHELDGRHRSFDTYTAALGRLLLDPTWADRNL